MLDRLDLLDRAARHREIHQMQEHSTALHVTQEAVPQASPFGGAGDQSRQVGDDEGIAVGPERHDAELRYECGERIVGDLRASRGNHADQRRLAGVGQADDTDVGQQLELQLEAPRLSLLAGIGAARRLIRRGGETSVAATATPAVATMSSSSSSRISPIHSSVSASRTTVPNGTST